MFAPRIRRLGGAKMTDYPQWRDLRQGLHDLVVADVLGEVGGLLAAVAEEGVDGGEAGGEVADGVLRGHADAAVELDRLLADVTSRQADLQLGPSCGRGHQLLRRG